MNLHHRYLNGLAAVAVLLLSACGRNDVAPGNNSGSAVPNNTPTPAVTNATSPALQSGPVQRIQESDIIPDEYTTNNGSIDRLATVTVQPTAGNEASGMVAFIQADADQPGILVTGKFINLSPGLHGFHLHEIGNCTTPDGSSAGAHLNPTGVQHAGHGAAVRHLGDFGNLSAEEDGTATIDFTDDQLEFVGMNSFIGKAFIVHADEDDLTTQPSGNSGARIACGVIENRQPIGVPQ